MTDFHYNPPDASQYYKGILTLLKKKGHQSLYGTLKNGKCVINASSQFSHIRWNGMDTTVVFYLPLDDYEKLDIDSQEIKSILISICEQLMPLDVGYDVTGVDFALALDNLEKSESIENEIIDISTSLANNASGFTLPSDILTKVHEMSEIYLYLYIVENFLRLFIENVCKSLYGDQYFSTILVSKEVKKSLSIRKSEEARNQWISVRGGSELFYLDFKDLGDIIINNWTVFSGFFPDQAWIKTKIDELANCRNLVAHNSVVGDHEQDVIRVNFKSILRQIKAI